MSQFSSGQDGLIYEAKPRDVNEAGRLPRWRAPDVHAGFESSSFILLKSQVVT